MRNGVIFDMDGVLVDSGKAHAESWRAVARRYDISVSDDEFRRTFGRTSRDIVRMIWGDDTSEDDVQRHDCEKEAAYRDLIRGHIPLMSGVRGMLTALRDAELVLAVATSGPRENVDLVLGEARLGEFFSAVVTGFDVARGKPAPDCFLLAAERVGVTPECCVVVEDAPVGVAAAVAAHMPAIGFVGTHPAARLGEAGAGKTVERLEEITPVLIHAILGSR